MGARACRALRRHQQCCASADGADHDRRLASAPNRACRVIRSRVGWSRVPPDPRPPCRCPACRPPRTCIRSVEFEARLGVEQGSRPGMPAARRGGANTSTIGLLRVARLEGASSSAERRGRRKLGSPLVQQRARDADSAWSRVAVERNRVIAGRRLSRQWRRADRVRPAPTGRLRRPPPSARTVQSDRATIRTRSARSAIRVRRSASVR